MMKRLSILLVLAGGCASKSQQKQETARKGERAVEETQPVRVAGPCSRCNLTVYDGHVCGLTVPCALCRREHGARHYHEIAWKCETDEFVARETHVCNDSKVCEACLHATDANVRCELCRAKRHVAMLARACDYCARPIPVAAVRGITGYCATCNQEIGVNHIHGKTVFCETCLTEAGQGHVHDVTRLCATHERDCAADHDHGRTEYCQACRRDVGPNHRHGETVYCIRCLREAPWPHCHHLD
ncbi:MAG: hypothetical protein HYY17_03040 [Planctomycetes bacterium]|nr:hypothetical protein [Planctomycetota bacterium]